MIEHLRLIVDVYESYSRQQMIATCTVSYRCYLDVAIGHCHLGKNNWWWAGRIS